VSRSLRIVRLTVVMETAAATVTFVLRAPEQVEELAQRLRQKGLANIAVSIRDAVVEGKTDSEKALSDEERDAVCAVLTDAESDPALRRAFNLLCAEPELLEAT
jgi:uroporphyrinogen-III synthase